MNSTEMMKVISQMDENTVTHKTKRSQIPLFGTPFSILTKHGVNRHNNLVRFAKKILAERGFPPDLTFRQHAELKANNPHLKSIHLTAVNNSKTSGELTVFSSRNQETQDVELAEAFAAALAYPSVVIPVPVLVNGKINRYSDGGARDNYPYSIFPIEEWPRCLGIKLDTHEEIFGFHYQNPGLVQLFFWNLVTDNDYIYRRFPNTVQLFDGGISVLKPVTRIDREALYLSGELATDAFLKKRRAQEPKIETLNPAKTSQETLDKNARTKQYQKMMENDSGMLRHFFPLYYFKLLRIYNKLKSCKDCHECCVHYNALLDELCKNSSWTLSDVFFKGKALTQIQFDLFILLRERSEKAAHEPEATPQLIEDVVLAYLKTNDYKKVHEIIYRLERSQNSPKLLKINHHLILKMLNHNKAASKEKEQLFQLVEKHLECLLMTYPGAYEAYLTVQFGDFLEKKEYFKAASILKKMKSKIPEVQLNKIADCSMNQFEERSEQAKVVEKMFSVEGIRCESPRHLVSRL